VLRYITVNKASIHQFRVYYSKYSRKY